MTFFCRVPSFTMCRVVNGRSTTGPSLPCVVSLSWVGADGTRQSHFLAVCYDFAGGSSLEAHGQEDFCRELDLYHVPAAGLSAHGEQSGTQQRIVFS